MNVILKYFPDERIWVIWECGPLGAYWIIAMHATREGAIAMLERTVMVRSGPNERL